MEQGPTEVTKVPFRARKTALALALSFLCCGEPAAATATDSPDPAARPAEALYLQLGQVGLDPNRVFRVRDAALERPAIDITLEDGTIAFTQDVMGRITGAFFEGDGEILLQPPNEVERKSLSLFTGMAIVEERFATAYFRFNDDTANELRPGLRAADNAAEFISRWSETAHNLAQVDAMRLLMSFSYLLPAARSTSTSNNNARHAIEAGDRMLHARLQGTKLGIFDVYYDSSAGEQVEAGQSGTAENGDTYYDVWTSFSPEQRGTARQAVDLSALQTDTTSQKEDPIEIRHYSISTDVTPPKQIHSEARLEVRVKKGGQRALLFELSRSLTVQSVEMDGKLIEFIHNPAVEGTQLARRGNDVLAVILPDTANTGDKFELRFIYGGEVLAEAGGGLLYVGARGTWYPNRGMVMADFDLEFRYPPEWTLVATGKPTPLTARESNTPQQQTSRWVSDRPIPVAGFNLGKYKVAKTAAAGVVVEAYASASVERSFPSPPTEVVGPIPGSSVDALPKQRGVEIVTPPSPRPANNGLSVAEAAAQAIEYYAARFGPFPYSRLSLTQMPGRDSQGWPGLIFLSSYAFLNREERDRLHFDPLRALMQQQIPAHETAHQWWGDLINWSTYRDQWFSEGLANYCALMMLQEKNPAGFRQIMEKYRYDLVERDKEGLLPAEDGPVTLGTRLWSSRFPEGYEAISYGRGTWLFHMLRTMLQDGEALGAVRGSSTPSGAEEPFVRALRKVRERYQGKSMSTSELFDVFAEELPPSLRYEGKGSLQWFVDGWVNGTAVPRLELKSVKILPKGREAVVTGTIVQKDAPQYLVTSVPVYAVLANRSSVLLGRVFVDGEESTFRVTAPADARKILLDPNETILTNPK